MTLRDDQLERYARHIVLPDVGGVGQRALLEANVAVIGAGGLGAPILLYLAAAGVGRITLIDDDVVSLSNLQRQVLYDTADVGQLKVEVAAARLAALNPDCTVKAHRGRVDGSNAAGLLGGHDLVIDGCDNFQTRLTVSDACIACGVPLLSAAVGRFDGQLCLYSAHDGASPCYRCLVPEAPDVGGGTCAEDGVIGALTGVIGSWAALMAIQALTGAGDIAPGRLTLFDGLSARTRTINVRRDPACKACGDLA